MGSASATMRRPGKPWSGAVIAASSKLFGAADGARGLDHIWFVDRAGFYRFADGGLGRTDSPQRRGRASPLTPRRRDSSISAARGRGSPGRIYGDWVDARPADPALAASVKNTLAVDGLAPGVVFALLDRQGALWFGNTSVAWTPSTMSRCRAGWVYHRAEPSMAKPARWPTPACALLAAAAAGARPAPANRVCGSRRGAPLPVPAGRRRRAMSSPKRSSVSYARACARKATARCAL